MKNVSRILIAAVIAALLFVTMAAPGFAADGKITITNENDSVSMVGHTYTAYKIFDVVYNATEDSYDYTIAEGFEDFFAGLNIPATYGDDADARAYTYVSKISGDEALQRFARDAYAAKGSDAYSKTSDAATAETAEITGLDYGYYLVYDNGGGNTTDPARSAVANIALTTAASEAEVILKASVPTLDKKITGISDSADNTASDVSLDSADAKINDHITFTLESNVPNLTGYDDYTYIVTDTMSAGLTPDRNVKVVIKTTDVTSSCEVEYDGQVTTITVPYSTLSQYDQDDPITISYSALVNANASVYPSADGNSNEAQLEYSNDVNSTSTTVTPGTEVNVYLFSLELTKVNADNEALEGAEFTIQDKATNAYIPVALDGTVYKVSATLDATAENATVVSDAQGKIKIEGLAAGTYVITETEAPDGYNKLSEPVEVTITANYNSDGDLTGVSGNTATIINKAGGILPSTGGIGTTLFIAGGAVLMLAAVAAVVYKKKKTVSE